MKTCRISNRLRSLIVSCALVVLCLLHTACTASEPELVGLWQKIDHKETFYFSTDHGVSITTEKGKTLSGQWSVMDDGQYKIEVFAMGMTFAVTARIEQETLLIRESGGNISRYRKER